MSQVNKLDKLFQSEKRNLLNIYCTAGYPALDSLHEVIASLQEAGVDLIEIGMPYSDPIADGPIIQQSNMKALQNGMTLGLMFEQLQSIAKNVHIPVILMGYFNPVLQFGIEKFCSSAQQAGVSAVIIPDLPMYEFQTRYKIWFEKYDLRFIFLVSPDTDKKRIKLADKLSSGFLYAVSSSSTTGQASAEPSLTYFERLKNASLKNPIMIGFGIHDRTTFRTACVYARGAIIGSAYIKALGEGTDINTDTKKFVGSIIDATPKAGIEV